MIVAMKRVSLVALKADEEAILKKLQEIGTVEMIHLEDNAAPDSKSEQAQEELRKLADSLEAVKPFAEKKSFLSPQKREESLETVNSDKEEALRLSEEIETLQRRSNKLIADREKAELTIKDLLPWKDLPYRMQSVVSTGRVQYFVGYCASKDLDKLMEQEYLMPEIVTDTNNVGMVIACHKEDVRAAQHFLKSIDWTDYVFPKMEGTPSEAIDALHREIAAIEQELTELAEQMQGFGAKLTLLENASDATNIEYQRCSAANDLMRTNAAFFLDGWVREDEVEQTEQAIATVTDAYSFTYRDPSEDENPPSAVKNNSIVKPFEAVQDLYSAPVYGTVDGTPLMTPFYILLFGLMLSDTGYGLLLLIGAFAYLKIKKPTGMSGGIARVLMWGGVSTMVWGVLVGSCFGITQTHASGGVFDQIADVFARIGIFPMFLDPMEDSMLMLGFCLGIGVLHLLCAYMVRVVLEFKRGDWKAAIFDHFSWVMILLGLVVGFFPQIAAMAGFSVPLPRMVTLPAQLCAALGAVLILLFKGRNKPKLFGKLTGGLGELYNITSVLSDILSYARLFGLGIATGVIAQVFNTLSGMLLGGSSPVMQVVGPIVCILLLIVLHTINIAINTLGAFIHTARLQYVEYYSRFYEAGGRAFNPLSYKTKHVQVTK